MALTSYITPLALTQDESGSGAARINHYQPAATGTYNQGDLLAIGAGGVVSAATATAATDTYTILGICAAKTVITTLDTSTQVPVIEALPGVVFSGHLVSDATTSLASTTAASDVLGKTFSLRVCTNLATLGGTQTAYAVATSLAAATDGACVRTLGWAKQQAGTLTQPLYSLVAGTMGILSPRINFVFSRTWFTINPVGTVAL